MKKVKILYDEPFFVEATIPEYTWAPEGAENMSKHELFLRRYYHAIGKEFDPVHWVL